MQLSSFALKIKLRHYRTGERRRKSCLVLPLILIVVCLPTGVFTGVVSSLCVAGGY